MALHEHFRGFALRDGFAWGELLVLAGIIASLVFKEIPASNAEMLKILATLIGAHLSTYINYRWGNARERQPAPPPQQPQLPQLPQLPQRPQVSPPPPGSPTPLPHPAP